MITYFVRYDPQTGEILAAGQMMASHVDMLNQRGEHYLKTAEKIEPNSKLKVDLETLELIPYGKSFDYDEQYLSMIINAIRADLFRTDYTQAIDANDHLTEQEQSDWREYRVAIRNAQNLTTFEQIVEALPNADPKGNDAFTFFKEILAKKKLFDKPPVDTI